jgi:AraC-like DNA-binding protein
MYAERPPASGLTGRIACEWLRTSDTSASPSPAWGALGSGSSVTPEQRGGGRVLVVPDACVDLIWGDGVPFVAGPDTGPMPTSIRAGETMAGVRFKPGAVGAFFGVPLTDLLDRRVPLADLPGGHAFLRELTDGPASTAGERLHAMRAAVRRRLLVPHLGYDADQGLDPVAPAIATALSQGRTVSEVAWSLGFSERQLQRRSVSAFGYAPKTLQRIVRFQHALRLARTGLPLARVAATAGYTDQAHMANDVRRLSGGPMSHLL